MSPLWTAILPRITCHDRSDFEKKLCHVIGSAALALLGELDALTVAEANWSSSLTTRGDVCERPGVAFQAAAHTKSKDTVGPRKSNDSPS